MSDIEGLPAAKEAERKIVHADPTKDFFVTMITRDISLRDCIFDLLDNAIDGARRTLSSEAGRPFSSYTVELDFGSDYFQISDNCGGIRLSDAIDYAFHFGRKPGSPADVRGGIGLYGIGMKRAIFKIGRTCVVVSHAKDESFRVLIDVDSWERQAGWEFEYEDIPRENYRGTSVRVSRINRGVGELLGDGAFENQLVRAISRDYSFFIQEGLKIIVKGNEVPSFKYQLNQSENMTPLVEEYEDEGVKVRILAGFVDDLEDDIPEEIKPEKVDRYGWFVICNNRVVLAADKSDQTIWGVDGFNVWHPQYNSFAGFLFFDAEDQGKLPWTTTKRELDISSPLYRRAIVRMKKATHDFIAYTNRRKSDPGAARAAEGSKRIQVVLTDLRVAQPLKLPAIQAATRPSTITISYQRDKREVEELKRHMGQVGMSASQVGVKTFEYYRAAELGK